MEQDIYIYQNQTRLAGLYENLTEWNNSVGFVGLNWIIGHC